MGVITRRIILVLFGLPIFLFLASAPTVCMNRRGFRGWYWRTVSSACSMLLRLLSIRVVMSEDARKTLAEDQNSIIAVNHRSHLDGFALLDVIPAEKWVTFGAKKEFFSSFLLKRGFRGAGLVEIDRSSGKDALETLTNSVNEMPVRRSVILFVEGTRARGPGLGKFKAGAVLVARETGRQIRPIVISGSDILLSRDKTIPKPGTIHIDVLAPQSVAPSASVDDALEHLRSTMAACYDARTGETTPPSGD